MDDEQKTNSQAKEPGKEPVASDKLAECEKQRDEYLNGWRRATADLINYKKEEAKRFEEFGSFTVSAVVKELLPILDSFEFALNAVKGNESAEKGLLLIKNQLEEALKRQGVERIATKPGDELNLNIHEAVLAVEVADHPELSGKIVEELSPGYKLNGRTIRAAKVKVGK